jgi:hypothetical protein
LFKDDWLRAGKSDSLTSQEEASVCRKAKREAWVRTVGLYTSQNPNLTFSERANDVDTETDIERKAILILARHRLKYKMT